MDSAFAVLYWFSAARLAPDPSTPSAASADVSERVRSLYGPQRLSLALSGLQLVVGLQQPQLRVELPDGQPAAQSGVGETQRRGSRQRGRLRPQHRAAAQPGRGAQGGEEVGVAGAGRRTVDDRQSSVTGEHWTQTVAAARYRDEDHGLAATW